MTYRLISGKRLEEGIDGWLHTRVWYAVSVVRDVRDTAETLHHSCWQVLVKGGGCQSIWNMPECSAHRAER